MGQLVRPDRLVQQADKNSMHSCAVDLTDSDGDNIDVELKPNQTVGRDKGGDPQDVIGWGHGWNIYIRNTGVGLLLPVLLCMRPL
jgi:hypothetical protein